MVSHAVEDSHLIIIDFLQRLPALLKVKFHGRPGPCHIFPSGSLGNHTAAVFCLPQKNRRQADTALTRPGKRIIPDAAALQNGGQIGAVSKAVRIKSHRHFFLEFFPYECRAI